MVKIMLQNLTIKFRLKFRGCAKTGVNILALCVKSFSWYRYHCVYIVSVNFVKLENYRNCLWNDQRRKIRPSGIATLCSLSKLLKVIYPRRWIFVGYVYEYIHMYMQHVDHISFILVDHYELSVSRDVHTPLSPTPQTTETNPNKYRQVA